MLHRAGRASWRVKMDGFWSELSVAGNAWPTMKVCGKKFNERVRQIDDPRLTTGFVYRLRTSLPVSIGKINGELALDYAEAGEPKPQDHPFMRETNRGLLDIEKTAQLVLASATNRLKEQILTAQRCSAAKPADGANAARELAEQATRELATFDLLCGPNNRFRNDLFDEVADVCNKIQRTYDQATGDETSCIEILEAVLPFTTFASLRKQFDKNITILTKRLAGKRGTVFRRLHGTAAQSTNETPEQQVARVVMKNLGEKTLGLAIARLKSMQDGGELPSEKLASVNGIWLAKLERTLAELPGETDAFAQLCTAICNLLRAISQQAADGRRDMATAIRANQLAHRFAKTPELLSLLDRDQANFRAAARTSNDKEAQAPAAKNPVHHGAGRPSIRTENEIREQVVTPVLVKHFGEKTLDSVIAKLTRVQTSKDIPIQKLKTMEELWLAKLNRAVSELPVETDAYWILCAAAAKALRTISLQAIEKPRDMTTAIMANELAFRFAKAPEFWSLLVKDQQALRQITQSSKEWKIRARVAFALATGCLILYGNDIRKRHSDAKSMGIPVSQRNALPGNNFVLPEGRTPFGTGVSTPTYTGSSADRVGEVQRQPGDSMPAAGAGTNPVGTITYQIPASLTNELAQDLRAIAHQRSKVTELRREIAQASYLNSSSLSSRVWIRRESSWLHDYGFTRTT